MKKANMIIFLVLTMGLLSACAQTGRKEVKAPPPPPKQAVVKAPPPPPKRVVAKVPPMVGLESILQRRELVVGTSGDQPPLTAKTKEGKIIGLDADLSRLMAEAMGVKLRIVAIPFPRLIPMLKAGRVDMVLSGVGMTPERNLKVAFVGPYYVSGKGLLTKSKKIAILKDLTEINTPDYTLAVLKGSTSQLYAEKRIPRAKLVTTLSLNEALGLLLEDKVGALLADYPFCVVTAFRHKNRGLTAVEGRFTVEPLGIALPADDLLLVNWVENFLTMLRTRGELAKLKDRWFKDASWIKELP